MCTCTKYCRLQTQTPTTKKINNKNLGSTSQNYYIHCSTNDTCLIHCLSYDACDKMVLICNGTCLINCDQNDGFSCPLINETDNAYKWYSPHSTYLPSSFPSNYPSKIPTTMEPSFIPSYIPTGLFFVGLFGE